MVYGSEERTIKKEIIIKSEQGKKKRSWQVDQQKKEEREKSYLLRIAEAVEMIAREFKEQGIWLRQRNP